MKIVGLITFMLFAANSLFAAEAGMPNLTQPIGQVKYSGCQIFSSIYFLIAKIFIPKIKNNIDARESQIRKDIDEASLLKEEADKKLKKYNQLIKEAKINAKKIISEGRKKLNEDLQSKKEQIEKEIQKENDLATKDIEKFKISSSNKVNLISEEIVSNIIKEIFGEDLNKSSIQATISEVIKAHKN